MSITQVEYDQFMAHDKEFEDMLEPLLLGPAPIHWSRAVQAVSTREKYLLDFRRGSFKLSKFTINKRFRTTIIMLRYCHTGRHTNPDGVSFNGPHVHLYREGYNDQFAFPVSTIGVAVTDGIGDVFEKALIYCNVTLYPTITVTLF